MSRCQGCTDCFECPPTSITATWWTSGPSAGSDAVGTLKANRCILAATHGSLRLTREDQPVQVREFVDQTV